MAEFFQRLSEQVLEQATVVQPLRAVRFARLPDMQLPGPTALRQPLSAPTDDGLDVDPSDGTVVLTSPVVLLYSAAVPTAVLKAEILLNNAPDPTATFAEPPVLVFRACKPIAVFSIPPVLL